MVGTSSRPNEGEVVTVGPFFVHAPVEIDGPVRVIVYYARGVRCYAEHNGETIPFVDCCDDQPGHGIVDSPVVRRSA